MRATDGCVWPPGYRRGLLGGIKQHRALFIIHRRTAAIDDANGKGQHFARRSNVAFLRGPDALADVTRALSRWRVGKLLRPRVDGRRHAHFENGLQCALLQRIELGVAWPAASGLFRSEERRVGKECRSRWSRYH